MSYITSFMDGEKYGANEINKIVSRFITSGIEDPFIDGEPYNVRRLNDLSKPVTTRGVIGSESTALLVVKSGEEYFISPGTAFFGNGSTLEVTEAEPISLGDMSVTNYVYLVSNEEENRNYIEVNTVEPDITNENIVMLCEISADGVITDRRCYATGKIRGMYQDNEFTLKSIRIQDNISFEGNEWDAYFEHDLGCSDFSLMILVYWRRTTENGDYAKASVTTSSTNHERNCIQLWMPKSGRRIGLATNKEEGEKGFSYCCDTNGSTDAPFWGSAFLLNGGLNGLTGIDLRITHVNGNIWKFHYERPDNRYTKSFNTDFKLFYI